MKNQVNTFLFLTFVCTLFAANSTICMNTQRPRTPEGQRTSGTIPGAPRINRTRRRRRAAIQQHITGVAQAPQGHGLRGRRTVNRDLIQEFDQAAIVDGRRAEAANYQQARRSETRPEA